MGLREAAQMALDAYESRMQQIGGCSDGGCVVVKPKGMHTNGGCRCWKNERSMQRLAMAANSLTKALRAALAQPEQEPWGYISHKAWKMPVFVEADDLQAANLPFNNPDYTPVYKAPPQREWQGLTDEEMFNLWVKCPAETEDRFAFARAIEQALREKNSAN